MSNQAKGSARWMFSNFEPGGTAEAIQTINIAFLRLLVVGIYKPIAKPLLALMTRRS